MRPYANTIAAFLAALSLSAFAKAATVTKQSLHPVVKVESLAACQALTDLINRKAATLKQPINVLALEKEAHICREIVPQIYSGIHALGPNYVVWGLGLFVAPDFNIPLPVKNMSTAFRMGFGASFFSFSQTGPGLTPFFNLVPIAPTYAFGKRSPPADVQLGLIVFYTTTPNAVKDINSLNGFYTGISGEWDYPFRTALRTSKGSVGGSWLTNFHGSRAVIAMLDYNNSEPVAEVQVPFMAIDNITNTGEGLTWHSLVDLVKSNTATATNQAVGDAKSGMHVAGHGVKCAFDRTWDAIKNKLYITDDRTDAACYESPTTPNR